MADQPLGELPVIISGDWSELQDAITEATQAAESGADKIASALDVNVADTATQSIQALGTSLSDLSQDASQVGSSVEDVASSVTSVGSAASSSASGLNEFAGAATSTGEAASEADSGLSGMVEQLTLLGEALAITEGLKEFGQEALTAYGTVQSVTIGLTALTGSATQANEIITQVKELAATEPFAFPEIAPTVQRMVALGVSTEQIGTVMQAAADASAATGNAFSNVANMIDRMTLSGQANARTMATLGLSTVDLGNAMGVTAAQATKAFAALDQSQRIDVVATALQKFAGTAEAEAQGIAGQWQIFKNQFEEVMVGVGEALAPVVSQIVSAMRDDVLPAVQEAITWFEGLPTPVKDAAVAIGVLAAAVVPLTAGLAAVGLAIDALSGLLPAASGLLAAMGYAGETAATGLAAEGAAATEAATGTEVLAGAVGLLSDAVPIAAAAFGAWKLAEWASQNESAQSFLASLNDELKTIGEAGAAGLKAVENAATSAIGPVESFFNAASSGISKLSGLVPTLGSVKTGIENLIPGVTLMEGLWNSEKFSVLPLNLGNTRTALQGVTDAMLAVQEPTDTATKSVVALGAAQDTANTAAKGHKQTLDTMATATVPTLAQAVANETQKIQADISGQTGALQIAMGAWASLATSGTASEQALADAASKVAHDAQQLNLSASDTADAWQVAFKAMGLSTDTLIAKWNDDTQKFGAGSDQAKADMDALKFVFGGDVDAMTGAINTFGQAHGGLVTVINNGKPTFVQDAATIQGIADAADSASAAALAMGQAIPSAANSTKSAGDGFSNAAKDIQSVADASNDAGAAATALKVSTDGLVEVMVNDQAHWVDAAGAVKQVGEAAVASTEQMNGFFTVIRGSSAPVQEAIGDMTHYGQAHTDTASATKQNSQAAQDYKGTIIDLTNYVHSSTQTQSDYASSVTTTAGAYGDLEAKSRALTDEFTQNGDPALQQEAQDLDKVAQAAADAAAGFDGLSNAALDAQGVMGGAVDTRGAATPASALYGAGGSTFGPGTFLLTGLGSAMPGGPGLGAMTGSEQYNQWLAAQELPGEIQAAKDRGNTFQATALQKALDILTGSMDNTTTSTKALDHALVGGSLKPSLDLTQLSTVKLDQSLGEAGLSATLSTLSDTATTSAVALASATGSYSQSITTLSNGTEELAQTINGITYTSFYGNVSAVTPPAGTPPPNANGLNQNGNYATLQALQQAEGSAYNPNEVGGNAQSGFYQLANFGFTPSTTTPPASTSGLNQYGNYATLQALQQAEGANFNANEVGGSSAEGFYQLGAVSSAALADQIPTWRTGSTFTLPVSQPAASGTSGGGNSVVYQTNISGLSPGNAQYVMQQQTNYLRMNAGLKIT